MIYQKSKRIFLVSTSRSKITLGAEVKSLSRNTNASAMVLSGNTVYLAKAHANENGKMIYKSICLWIYNGK